MRVCRRLHQLPLIVLFLILLNTIAALLPVLEASAHASSEARSQPPALQDVLQAKLFPFQPLKNRRHCLHEGPPLTGSILYSLRATKVNGRAKTPPSCSRELCPNIGFLRASFSLRPALSNVSCKTRAGWWLAEQHGSCLGSRLLRHQSRTPPKPPLCALPRSVRASRLLMPSAGHAGCDVSGDSRSQTDNRVELRPSSGEHLDSAASLNAEATPSHNDEGIERQGYVGNRGAASAAFGRLLERARLLQSVASGLFCVLPLGFRVMKKIETICHEELERAGATPLSLPSLMPLEWIRNSNRIASFGTSLYKLHDRRGRELFLPPTSEEAAAWLAATNIRSHRDLPLMFYQIGQKFRDELRPRAGCLRTREFVMLEAYSFHQEATCRGLSYQVMDKCFRRILARVGAAPVHRVAADPGTMGGCCSHEYHVPSPLGEDVTTQALAAQGAEQIDHSPEDGLAQECGPTGRTLEVGHCFQLPATYCEAAKARFADFSGAVKVPLMNSYGLGVSRLFGHLAATHQDAKGLKLPPQVAPFFVAVLLQSAQRSNACRRVARVGEALFRKLGQVATEAGSSADVLLDDRRGIPLGQMQAHADLVGIPHQILIKEELLKPPGPARVLYVERRSGKIEVQTPRNALKAIKRALLQLASVSEAGSVPTAGE